MYKKVDKKPEFNQLEQRILEFWEEHKCFEKLREKNKNGPKWSFQDGPITANNPMGIHHAWGRALKDMYQRYHGMCGHELRYQNGFDCQGLWVEVEVEKEHGFKSKKDIEKYGVAKFVEDCKQRVVKYSQIQTEQSIRLGYWMDWNNSYFTMSEMNNYTIWTFLKKCFERGYIKNDYDAMPWCPRCGVGLSQMEMHEGYKWVEHKSVFAKFPLRDRKNEAVVIWTTTPWTLTSNVAVAVNPDSDYLKIKQGDWTYYVGAANWENQRAVVDEEATGKKRKSKKLQSIPQHFEKHGPVEIIGKVRGKEMLGWQYDGPFDEFAAQQEKGGYPHQSAALIDRSGTECHKVIPWDEVSGAEGTGIVHIAPGCGKEDFLLGHEHGLVSISPIDEMGRFYDGFGFLSSMAAPEVADHVINNLKEKGILIAAENYPHRYAHCWRCGTGVLYRMVDEWYIDMCWRDEIKGLVEQIRWIPEFGKHMETDWLNNMGDWMISKKRYWGLALPIWRCAHGEEIDPKKRCDWFTVIGSKEELKEKAISGWDKFDGHTPHRPYVDEVKIKCEKCGAEASRIPDVGNPWLDAGIVPYSTMNWIDEDYWKKWYPADLVLECFPGQFRNWFYAMLAMCTLMQEDKWADKQGGKSQVVPPFRTLLGHALVKDYQGNEMHKSLGNSIDFKVGAEKLGAEVMRYLFAAQNPSQNLNFPNIFDDSKSNIVRQDTEIYRNLLTLWNCYSFYVTYAAVDDITPSMLKIPVAERSEIDKWILSKFQRLVQAATLSYENYRLFTFMGRFERFLDDLSNWYVRRSRRRFWKSENDGDKLAAFATLFEVIEGVCYIMAPILPFLSEEIYQNIVRSVDKDAPESIHLVDFPKPDEALIDEVLEGKIDTIIKYKNLGLSVRNKHNLKVRQPLASLLVQPLDNIERDSLLNEDLAAQLKEELNVKEITLIESKEGLVKTELKPVFASLSPKYKKSMKGIIAYLKEADAEKVLADINTAGAHDITLDGAKISLLKDDIECRMEGLKGLAVTQDGDSFVAMDITVTDALKQEGIARDFVRGVQLERRKQDLHVADRIALHYQATGDVAKALENWKDYICQETLAVELVNDDAIEKEDTRIKLQKAAVPISIRVK